MNPEKLFPQPERLDLPLVDLAAAPFWLIFLSAVVLLPLIREARLRQGVLAFLNLGFLTLLCPTGLPLFLTGLGLFWLALRGVQGAPQKAGYLWGTAGAALILFVFYKRPDWAIDLGLARLNLVLAAMAFSYVVLRAFEVFRAVWEGRHPCPGPVVLTNYLLPFNMIAAGPIVTAHSRCPGLDHTRWPLDGPKKAGLRSPAFNLF